MNEPSTTKTTATVPATRAAVKKAPVKKAAVSKAPVKKAAAKKAPAKKAAAKKAPAKKAAAKKAPAKKAAAKKEAPKSSAKKSSAKKSATGTTRNASAPTRPALAAPPTDPLAVLGLQPNHTLAELKRAWRDHAAVHHPDVGGDSVTFTRGRHAFEALREALRR